MAVNTLEKPGLSGGPERESGMELLRIVLMFMILILHANVASIGAPSSVDVVTSPLLSFVRFLVQACTIVSVDAFILLSGWFGIHFKVKRLVSLTFQVLFFSIGIYVVFSLLGSNVELTLKDFFYVLTLSDYWFVIAYIILYALSPVLNAFVESSSRSRLLHNLVFLFVLQLVYGWLPAKHNWYDFGYSPLAFMNLYLLGRYLKFYLPQWCQRSRFFFLYWFVSLEVLVALLSFITVGFVSSLSSIPFYLYLYTSPFAILGGVFLLLFFSRLKFKSTIINWIASSSFAVYLLHAHPLFFKNFYSPFIVKTFEKGDWLWSIIRVGIFMIIIYIIAILLDKVRYFLWRIIARNSIF